MFEPTAREDAPMTILFLHGGPGRDAAAERAWFGASIPVDWWDQPSVAGLERPFRALCDAAQGRLEHWHAASGAPVPLLAHSFGAAIAHALYLRRPELISQLVLLTPVFDPLAALGIDLQADPATLAGRADLFDAWWSDEAGEIRRRVHAHLPHGPHFDADSFVAAASDYLRHRDSPPLPAEANAMVVFGTADRLRREDAVEEALRHFPRAEIRWMPCAHQPLFELSDVPMPA
jgi:pimeloyl-ACP methyl ester carboxylesterase